MKILHCVEFYYPSVGGMQEVVKQLSERLVERGHHVTVATSKRSDRREKVINGVRVKDFGIQGKSAYGITGKTEKYTDFLLNTEFDVITFFGAQQWATDLALPILKKIKARKVSVPTGFSGLYTEAFREYFENMKTWIHDYDMNVFLSHDYRDINFAKENGVRRYMVIPNAASEAEFLSSSSIDIKRELNIPEDHFLILQVGTFTGIKGQADAAEIFLRSGIKKATLLLIGNRPENFRFRYRKLPLIAWLKLKGFFSKKKIIAGSYSRKFTVAAMRQSNLFLFPSNIECSPIVLFECAAARLPFLSNDVGNAREIAEWTGGGLILPTDKNEEGYSFARIKESAKMLEELYVDEAKRRQMAEKSFQSWKEKFTWEKITLQYEKLYSDLTENNG